MVRIKVVKGTHQIGGCITVISSENSKIVIDFGEDLDEEAKKHVDKEKLLCEIKGADKVFITHSHGDHVGLVNLIPEAIPVFMEEMTKRIIDIGADFGVNASLEREVSTFHLYKDVENDPIDAGDFKVTPYIVDHSSYNSCMFLIEAEGKRILHTGDYRSHGRKGGIFASTLEKIGHVDCLITEGTTLSRSESERYMSEFKLEKKAKELFSEYDQIFVLASSTNLDRIVSFYKAKGDKSIVFDTFTSAVTEAVDFKITGKTSGVYRWNPIRYRNSKSEEFKKKYMDNSFDYGFLPKYIMFLKPSMLLDVRKLKKEGLITKACLVYSMWNGYLEKDKKLQELVSEIEKMGIDFHELHTSGHADAQTMKKMNEVLRPDHTIIIHTEDGSKGVAVFDNTVALEDGKIYEL